MAGNIVKQADSDIIKLMPQNIEAEEAVLGAVLINPESLGRIEFLKPESFYKPSHKIIFKAMLDMYRNNIPIDIVTVSEYLRNEDKLESIGGRAYINDLSMGVITTVNIEYYAKIIQEKEIKRSLINAGSEIVSMSYENEDTNKVLDDAQRMIFNIASERETTDLVPIQDILISNLEKVENRYNNKEELTGIPTGFYDLDGITCGLQKGDLIVLAARPSMGKTAFALNIAQNVALKTDKTVVIFSLEMPKEQIGLRMWCSEAEVDTRSANAGTLQNRDWNKLTEASDRLADTKIWIDDTGGISTVDIKAKCRRLLLEKRELGLIVIDYLQLMEGGGNPNDRNQQISAISRSLKALAKELNVPIIALSQLSRNVEQRPDKHPVLSDLRDSGAIEQDADIVMFIYRDEYYLKEKSEKKGKAEIIIAKHRNGEIGSFELLFHANITKFKNPTKTDLY